VNTFSERKVRTIKSIQKVEISVLKLLIPFEMRYT